MLYLKLNATGKPGLTPDRALLLGGPLEGEHEAARADTCPEVEVLQDDPDRVG
jgi:hypothetical protein